MSLLDNLQAYFAFDGDLLDSSGNGRHGTNGGAAFAAGQHGQALSVAGAGGRVDYTSHNLQPATNTPFSMAAWIKPSSLPASYGQIVGASLGTPAFYLKSDGYLSYYDDINGADHLSTSTIAVGVWTHVVATYAGTAGGGAWKIYINGVLSGSGTQGTLRGILGAVGGNPSFSSPFLGLIEDVALYDRELSGAEAVELAAGAIWPFADPAPSIDDVDPGFGPAAGGTEITITGADFHADATVEVGGVPATGVVFVGDTTLTATTPALAPGLHDVVVTNPDDQSDTQVEAWEAVAAPEVSSVTPSTGTEEGGTATTINGTGFQVGAAVTIGGVAPTSVVRVNSTAITAVTPAGEVGPADVVVTNPDDQTGTLAGGFVYTHAELTPEADALVKLLPPGVLWLLEIGSALRNLLRGIADEFKRIRLRGGDLIEESDPRTATETLEDWERVLSLPDDLVTSIPATTAGRQVAVTQKYVARGGSSDEFYELLCEACGYPLLSITRHAEDVLRSGTAQCGESLVGIADAYTITLELDAPTAGALTEAQFEAVIRARTHSHIQVVFTHT